MYYTEDMLLKKTSFNNGSNDFLQFLNPFHNDVWFATLATMVVISVSIFVINYFSPYGNKDANGRGTSEEFSFFNSVWFAMACMLQQGSESQPRSLSGTELRGGFIALIFRVFTFLFSHFFAHQFVKTRLYHETSCQLTR